MKRYIQMILILFMCSSVSFAKEDPELLLKIRKAVKAKELDFAFMYYQNILQQSRSLYFDDALFASAEYYFLTADYKDAKKYFQKYLQQDESGNGKLFALMYLRKIAQIQHNPQELAEIEDKVLTYQQQSFIFRDHKEYGYDSPLDRAHQAFFYVDRVSFYVEGKLFEEISY